jgi:hypothetical protein
LSSAAAFAMMRAGMARLAYRHDAPACVWPRVDFFVAGVQKGGTTALDAMLRRHPEIQMAQQEGRAVKEIHFFDDETVDWSAPDYQRLHRHYDWSVTRVRGEATPIYTFWPNALARLRAYHPHAKLLVLLRHPIHRAYSHWRMERARQHEPLDFATAIREGRLRTTETPEGARIYSYVERGHFDEQIERLLALFPRAQVWFARSDHLFAEPERVLGEIGRFLGIAGAAAIARRDYVRPVPSEPGPGPSQSDIALLHDEYAPRYARIEALTCLDLGDWRDPEYEEPMRPPAPDALAPASAERTAPARSSPR